MHPENPYLNPYDLENLAKKHLPLQEFIIVNPVGEKSIDFSNPQAVFALNKSLLISDFKLIDYILPKGYLIPPIPGRLDYLLHLNDFVTEMLSKSKTTPLSGLDIGCGANGIYCLLGAQYFHWKMVGCESDAAATAIVQANVKLTKDLDKKIDIRHQTDKSHLFQGVIKYTDQFDFCVCNPPFHASREAAFKSSLRKLKNLENKKGYLLNFEGQANELWCNGGEALFIKRLIKESVLFKDQVTVFSSLVSRAENLPKIEKQLQKIKANHKIIPMAQGNKKSRIIVWWF